jgi:hypothetical protein
MHVLGTRSTETNYTTTFGLNAQFVTYATTWIETDVSSIKIKYSQNSKSLSFTVYIYCYQSWFSVLLNFSV